MNLESFKFELYSEETGRVCWEGIEDINFLDDEVTVEINEDGDDKTLPLNKFKMLRYTEVDDYNGDEIYEGYTVHQVGVIPGCDIDFTGYVKFSEGAWWIDNGKNAVKLWNNECTENYIVGRENYGD